MVNTFVSPGILDMSTRKISQMMYIMIVRGAI